MTGQIPPYGKRGFALHRATYAPGWNQSVYSLKADPAWCTRSEYGSKTWHVWGPNMIHDGPFKSLTLAMDHILQETA